MFVSAAWCWFALLCAVLSTVFLLLLLLLCCCCMLLLVCETQLLREPVVPHDLVSGRNGVTRPWHWAPVQQRDCEGPSCRASQSSTPRATTQPPPCPGGDVVPIAPWLWRERTKTARSRRSNDHQLRLPVQPSVPDNLLRTAPGTWPPSFFSPSTVQLRRGWRPFLKLTRRAKEVKQTSCQLPAVPLAISSNHLQPLPTSARLKR